MTLPAFHGWRCGAFIGALDAKDGRSYKVIRTTEGGKSGLDDLIGLGLYDDLDGDRFLRALVGCREGPSPERWRGS